MMVQRLPLFTPSEEANMLREAGFVDVALFYASLSFRGWIASGAGSVKG
jgi:tRNA (cmo5U34)-methyltransferase